MNIYVCVDHDGHYVGVASVIVAETEEKACELLDAELGQHGLLGSNKRPYSLRRLSTEFARAYVLQDGDY